MPLTLQQALCIDAAVTEKTTCRFGVGFLSSEGISVRLHPPAFTNRRLSVGYKSLAVFVTAFVFDWVHFMPDGRACQAFRLYFPCICVRDVFLLYSLCFLPGGFLTNGVSHVIFSSITNAMTMLRIPHRFQRAGGWCEPAAGRKRGLPSEQNG